MSIPVTLEGKRKLQDDLSALEARVPVIRKAIQEAREKGDLRENAEYHAAREELGHVQGMIQELRSKLANAVVVDDSQIDRSCVAFGATVTLQDLDDDSREDWTLVGEGEDDVLDNKVLTSSPIGQAMLGHKKGDTIEVDAPAGKLKYKIIKIRY